MTDEATYRKRLAAAGALYEARRFEDAAQAFGALWRDGWTPEPVLVGLGMAEMMCGRPQAAVAAFSAIPNPSATAEVWHGFCLQHQERREEAEAAYRRALALADLPEALIGLGLLKLHAGELDEAEDLLTRYLAGAPQSCHGRIHLASLYRVRGRFAEAAKLYREAVAQLADHDPLAAVTHAQYGLTALAIGDFTTGFEHFEWRLRGEGVLRPRADRMDGLAPRWDGRVRKGGRILLWYEQGLGDTIHFARYAVRLGELGMRVSVWVPATLRRLFLSLVHVEAVLVEGEAMPPVDCQAPLMSVPHLLNKGGLGLQIPRRIPYLHANAAAAAAWRERTAVAPGAMKVGLAWAGNPNFSLDARRSVPLRLLRPLTNVPEVAFFSLQLGGTDCGLLSDMAITDLAPHLSDFADTAAAIAALDLVISVDTSVLHCAGALGKPAWALLPRIGDWRWGGVGHSCPWYPGMRLLRQVAAGHWESVVAEAARLLAREAAPKR